MIYAGLACLALCALVVVALWTFLPFVTANGRESQRIAIPVWAAVAGVCLLFVALYGLRVREATSDQVARAVAVSSALLGGVFLKWLCDLFARKPASLHERTLVKALLVAPLVPLACGSVFAATSFSPRLMLLWFANGFFWQTVFGDLERMRERERVIIRRREPPLPATPTR